MALRPGGAPEWLPLDTAFKLHDLGPGVAGMLSSVPFDEATYLSAPRTELTWEFYQQQIRNWLPANLPGTTVDGVPLSMEMIPETRLDGVVVASRGLIPYLDPVTIETDFFKPEGDLFDGTSVHTVLAAEWVAIGIDAFEGVDEDWRRSLKDEWSVLEEVHAVALDSDTYSIPKKSLALIQTALERLKSFLGG